MTGPEIRGPARERAGRGVRELIGRVAAEVLTDLPRAPDGDGPGELLARVRAARLVRDLAIAAMRAAALDARAVGTSWDDVAAVLELAETTDGPRRDELAYEYLIEHRCLQQEPTWLCQRPVAVWRCASCGSRVRDMGPFESHPDDREHGHTDDCARHEAARADWLSRVDEAFAGDDPRWVDDEQTDECEGGEG